MSRNLSKIKVCHITCGDLWAGAEAHLVTLLGALLKVPDLEISAILFNEGRLAMELRSLKIHTEVISESHHGSLAIFWRLLQYLRQHPVDILHTHKPKDNVLGAISSSLVGTRHRVRTIHGFPESHVGLHGMKHRVHRIVDNGVNRWLIDRVLAVSIDLSNHLMKCLGVQKVVCVQNGVNLHRVLIATSVRELRRELNIGEHEFVVGTMGRLTAGKGFECFLRAAQIIARKRENVKFIVVGDGPLRSSLERLTRGYGLDKSVFFLGHRDDNFAVLNLLNVFVLPSYSEGMPMVMLEALAQGLPVIATRVGGIPEVIEDSKTGLLVGPGKYNEIVENCIALMDDPERAQKLAAAGQKHVQERFCAKVMADQVAQVYRTLLTAIV